MPVQEEGLVVLPTHRLLREFNLTDEVLRELKRYFDISEIPPTEKPLEDFLKSHINEHAFCIYDGLKAYGLSLRHNREVYDFVNTKFPKKPRFSTLSSFET